MMSITKMNVAFVAIMIFLAISCIIVVLFVTFVEAPAVERHYVQIEVSEKLKGSLEGAGNNINQIKDIQGNLWVVENTFVYEHIKVGSEYDVVYTKGLWWPDIVNGVIIEAMIIESKGCDRNGL